MSYIDKDTYTEYQYLTSLRDQGKLLTLDGIRFICEANHYNPAAIGETILSAFPRIRPYCNASTLNKNEDSRPEAIVSKFGNGSVHITPVCTVDRTEGCIVLQNGNEPRPIGEVLSPDTFTREKDDNLLIFTNTKSIDALINQLQILKAMMNGSVEIPPEFIYNNERKTQQ